MSASRVSNPRPRGLERYPSLSANALIPRFNALHVDPRAEALNCFSQDWSEEINWCHPPVDQLDNLAQFLRVQGIDCESSVQPPADKDSPTCTRTFLTVFAQYGE